MKNEIKEGPVSKGGVNNPPTTPAPEPPKGQGGSRSLSVHSCNIHKYSGKDKCPYCVALSESASSDLLDPPEELLPSRDGTAALNMNVSTCRKELKKAKIEGIRMAAEQASSYDSTSSHPYRLEDCILAKFNLLPKNEIRKNEK